MSVLQRWAVASDRGYLYLDGYNGLTPGSPRWGAPFGNLSLFVSEAAARQAGERTGALNARAVHVLVDDAR